MTVEIQLFYLDIKTNVGRDILCSYMLLVCEVYVNNNGKSLINNKTLILQLNTALLMLLINVFSDKLVYIIIVSTYYNL